MKAKATLLIGGAIGYVLGARAGHERYEQIKSGAQGLWENPKVQEKKAQAQDYAREKAPEVQQMVTQAAATAAATAREKIDEVRDSGSGTSSSGTPYPTSASTGTT